MRGDEGKPAGIPLFEDEPVAIGFGWNLFVHDLLVAERADFIRKIHPVEFAVEDEWIVLPDPEAAQIVQARAAGSLVEVPSTIRKKLPNGHPLKPYAWRLYYMGYRQSLANDSKPAWLCIAAASAPEGPWVKPNLDPTSPQKNCTLRVDGLFQTEVTLRDGQWSLSATRLGMGEAQQSPGIHVYESMHGIFWEPPPGVSGAVIGMNVAPQAPSKYGRASHISRLVYDDKNDRFVAYVGLLSNALGNARGVYFGDSSPQPQVGWNVEPTPLEAPGILGPEESELQNGIVYGDMVVWREGKTNLGLVQKEVTHCAPNEVLLATSVDQRHWVPVIDEALAVPVPVMTPPMVNHFMQVNSLTGGRPATSNGLWHFFVGGTQHKEGCVDDAPGGGIMRATSRAGGLVGLQADANTQAKLVTRKLTLEKGLKAQELRLNADVTDKLIVTLERLSPIGTKLVAMQKVVPQGVHTDLLVTFGIDDSIDEATSGVFQLSFLFTGGGEIFGFQLGDPLCSPNPCIDIPGKSTCSSVNGEAVCQCDPPLKDDGEGNCTDDPCKPDPCTMPNQGNCEVVDGAAVCTCDDGWVQYSAVCIADPCQAGQDEASNPTPKPCLPLKCHAPNGTPECFCPEGSTEALAGCVETDMRAFVTSMNYDALQIGGVEAADSICTAEAVNNGLLGSYAAWLSTPESPAATKFAQGGPWRTYDPKYDLWVKLVATNIGDLIDGTLHAPIHYTASGKAKGDNCLVWTGTTPKGNATPPIGNLGGSCGQWSTVTAGSTAMAGQCDKQNQAWTAAGPRECSEKLALYCLQTF